MTEEQNKLAELLEKTLEQWACAIESLQHAPESYDCDSAWRQHHEMRREVATLRDREPATEAVRDQVLEEAAKVVEDAASQVEQSETEYHGWDKHGHGDFTRAVATAVRALKGKGASQGVEGDQILALNSALEREAVRKLVSEVSRLCQEGWNETYAAAHSNACEEIMARLEILWGEGAASPDEQKG